MTAVGCIGGALIVGAYFLISEGIVSGSNQLYHALNLIGSILLATDFFTKKAWSGVALQAVYSGIAVWALIHLNIF